MNGERARERSLADWDEVRSSGLSVLRTFSHIPRERERTGRSWRWGNAVRTSYFLFARQKRRGATSQTRRNPVVPLTYCRSLWYCWKLLHAEKHSLNCRRVRRRRWRIFELREKERERAKKAVYSRFYRITSDNVLVQRRFIRHSNASSPFDLCECINYNSMNVWLI